MLLNVFSAPSIFIPLLVHPNQRGEDASSEFLAIWERKDRAALPGKTDQSSALAVPRVLVGLSISLE